MLAFALLEFWHASKPSFNTQLVGECCPLTVYANYVEILTSHVSAAGCLLLAGERKNKWRTPSRKLHKLLLWKQKRRRCPEAHCELFRMNVSGHTLFAHSLVPPSPALISWTQAQAHEDDMLERTVRPSITHVMVGHSHHILPVSLLMDPRA
jgi:hypothetical protein